MPQLSVRVTASNAFGSDTKTSAAVTVSPESPPRSLDSRVAWTGHSMVDDKFVVLETSPSLHQVQQPLAKAVQALGGTPDYDAETGPFASAQYRYLNSGTLGKDPLVSLLQSGSYDVFIGTEAHGGAEVTVQEHIAGSQGLHYAELWHQLAVEADCGGIYYQNFHNGTWGSDTPAQWRTRLTTEMTRWQQIPDYVNGRRAAGTPPLRIIPLLELMARVYDDIQAGTLTGVTMDDFFSDNVHFSALGAWMSQALCYVCIYRRNPADFPIIADYASAGFAGTHLPIPTPAVCDQLRPLIWDVVTSDPRTGVVEVPSGWDVVGGAGFITFASVPAASTPTATGGENAIIFGD